MTERILAIVLAAVLVLPMVLVAEPAGAASAAELLEQARGKSRDLEELQAVLNGPDANMRLATFEVMVDSGDPAIREMALDTALTSTDPVLQALALKRVVLAQTGITLSLAVDTSQPADIQENARNYLASSGNLYHKGFSEVDPKTGVFKMGGNEGQVSGTQVSFKYGYDKGILQMVDETSLQGPVMLYKGKYAGFIGTWKLR